MTLVGLNQKVQLYQAGDDVEGKFDSLSSWIVPDVFDLQEHRSTISWMHWMRRTVRSRAEMTLSLTQYILTPTADMKVCIHKVKIDDV